TTCHSHLSTRSSWTQRRPVLMATLASSNRRRSGLCRIWRGLYHCRITMVMVCRWHQAFGVGFAGFCSGADRHGYIHVCAEKRIKSFQAERRISSDDELLMYNGANRDNI